ncbi:hypothetical protein [Dyella psychrodurans]|nr:hypothetical protein [Dyella psychrodurans]
MNTHTEQTAPTPFVKANGIRPGAMTYAEHPRHEAPISIAIPEGATT